MSDLCEPKTMISPALLHSKIVLYGFVYIKYAWNYNAVEIVSIGKNFVLLRTNHALTWKAGLTWKLLL